MNETLKRQYEDTLRENERLRAALAWIGEMFPITLEEAEAKFGLNQWTPPKE